MITNPTGAGGQPQCVPGVNHQDWGSKGSVEPSDVYATRWGAFTSDSVTGKVGVATGIAGKRKAEKEAVRDCRTRGGSKCEVLLTFYNQCAAIASGANMSGGGSAISAAGAPTREEAAKIAISRCGGRATNCEIFLTECSYPAPTQ
ncbi:DUF4189 domain-containing protein [Pseudomonas sp. CGJS7]|uniref:DUF4189 domain-containing protein n=1 Tax=Pseudomonas sp. CGJS7 TaxID=3109348 RepID=UPI003FA7CDCE